MVTCPKCGKLQPDVDGVCNVCGSDLNAPSMSPKERRSQSARVQRESHAAGGPPEPMTEQLLKAVLEEQQKQSRYLGNISFVAQVWLFLLLLGVAVVICNAVFGLSSLVP